jgi:hypothetical protein
MATPFAKSYLFVAEQIERGMLTLGYVVGVASSLCSDAYSPCTVFLGFEVGNERHVALCAGFSGKPRKDCLHQLPGAQHRPQRISNGLRASNQQDSM